MTNVKVGDMAQVIRATPSHQWLLGRVVKIAKQCCFSDVTPSWQFEEAQRNGSVSVGCAPDHCLKRIDPLSDDETREERAQHDVPAPEVRKEVAHAVVTAGCSLGIHGDSTKGERHGEH